MVMMPDTIHHSGIKDCCEDQLDFDHYGDGVEWELWRCKKCKQAYVVPIQIERYFSEAEQTHKDY